MKDHEQAAGRSGGAGWQSNRRRRRSAAAALTAAVLGLSAGCAASSTAPSARSGFPGPGRGAAGGDSNARSGPASGGASGTVDSVSASGFTMATSAGQEVTVDEASSTTYQDGTNPTTASAIAKGDYVLVLGMTSGTTITARQLIVQPSGRGGSAASSAAGVIPFERGAPSTRQSRTVRSRRTTPRGPGRSSAGRQRTRPPKLRWPSTRAASSTEL